MSMTRKARTRVLFLAAALISPLTSATAFGDAVGRGKIEDDLEEWFVSRGGVLGEVAAHQFHNMGRGLLATKALADGDAIVTVPLALCLTKETATKVASGAAPETGLGKALRSGFRVSGSDEDAIALMLLLERARGPRSEWAPYVASLPAFIPQGALLSREVLRELDDEPTAQRLEGRGKELEGRFRVMQPKLKALEEAAAVEAKGAAGGSGSLHGEVATLKAWQWALAVVSSRALTFRGVRVLAPICDLFNYEPHPNQRAAASGEFYLEHHLLDKHASGGKGTLTVLSDRSVDVGQQVFEDYGDNPSSLYLDHHGFVPLANPHDCAPTTLEVTSFTSSSSGSGGGSSGVDSSSVSTFTSSRVAVLEKLRLPTDRLDLCVPSAVLIAANTASSTATVSSTAAAASEASTGWEGVGHGPYLWLAVLGLSETQALACEELLTLAQELASSGSSREGKNKDAATAVAQTQAQHQAGVHAMAASGACPLAKPSSSSSSSSGGVAFPNLSAGGGWAPSTLVVRELILPALEEKKKAATQARKLEEEEEGGRGGSGGGKAAAAAAAAVDGVGAGGGGEAEEGFALAVRYREAAAKLVGELITSLKSDADNGGGGGFAVAAPLEETEVTADGAIRSLPSSLPSSSSSSSAAAAAAAADPTEKKKQHTKQTAFKQRTSTWVDHPDCHSEDSPSSSAGKPGSSNSFQNSFECAVAVFNAWVDQELKFPVRKIEARAVPGMRIGAVATAPIEAEELYLSVPADAVMDSASARKSLTQAAGHELIGTIGRTGDPDFFGLLLHLLHEAKVLGPSQSKWWPYLRLLPELSEIKPPVTYSQAEMNLLKGTASYGAILQYNSTVQGHWRQLTDTRTALGQGALALLGPGALTEGNFRWAHYVLNSRAIWWGSGRHLVPLLDLINCLEGPGNFAARVHATRLDAHGSNANTLAPRGFAKEEQVFENYGQPNHVYLQYHGFVLDSNTHDCVAVTVAVDKADPGMSQANGGANGLRKRMKEFGLSRGSESFCIANPTKLAAARKEALTSGGGVRVETALGDPRLLVWLRLKAGKKDKRADVTAEVKALVAKTLAEYQPALKAQEGEAFLAGSSREGEEGVLRVGEGVGGFRGYDHPAARLVGMEAKLLQDLADALEGK